MAWTWTEHWALVRELREEELRHVMELRKAILALIEGEK